MWAWEAYYFRYYKRLGAIAKLATSYVFYKNFTRFLRRLYDLPHLVRYTHPCPREDKHHKKAGECAC